MDSPNGNGHRQVGNENSIPTGTPTGPRTSDLDNAERFVRDHGERVRYCHPWGKWLVYDGARWVVDDTGEVVRLMKDTVRRIYVEAATERDDRTRRALADHARRSESKTRITDALYLARSEEGVPVSPDQLDADPWALNIQNGTVDLRTGERCEPSQYSVYSLGGAFGEGAGPSREIRGSLKEQRHGVQTGHLSPPCLAWCSPRPRRSSAAVRRVRMSGGVSVERNFL